MALRTALLDAGHELAAQLLDYHDRERKPVWWVFYDRRGTGVRHQELGLPLEQAEEGYRLFEHLQAVEVTVVP